MAKQKVVVTSHKIESVEDLDRTLATIAQKKMIVQEKESKYNKDEQIRREQLSAFVNPINAEIEDMERALEVFCTGNRHLFPDDRKSMKLTHGICSFRKSPPSVKAAKKFTLASAIELIKRVPGYADKYIRNKEEINKEAILTDYAKEQDGISADELRNVGLVVEQDEAFYYELNLAVEGGK